jgi:hypothetical protein
MNSGATGSARDTRMTPDRRGSNNVPVTDVIHDNWTLSLVTTSLECGCSPST